MSSTKENQEEKKDKKEKENNCLDIYKKSVLWSKLEEAMNEMKEQNKLSKKLEDKINNKFNSFIFDELKSEKKERNKNIITGKVSNFSDYNGINTFYCKDVNIKIDNESLSIPELKIIGIDEKIKKSKYKK